MMVEVNAGERELVMREFEQIKFDVQDWAHLEKCAHFELIQEKGDRNNLHAYVSASLRPRPILGRIHSCMSIFCLIDIRGRWAFTQANATICVSAATPYLPCSRIF